MVQIIKIHRLTRKEKNNDNNEILFRVINLTCLNITSFLIGVIVIVTFKKF